MSDDQDLEKPVLGRRALLKSSLPVIAGVSLGLGCGGARLPTTVVSAGSLERFQLGVPTRLTGFDVFLVRTEEGLAALSGRCPHVGCGVEPTADGGFHCGCHGSDFSADGTVLQGPAQEDLTWYAVRIEGGEVEVDPTTEVAKGTYTAL